MNKKYRYCQFCGEKNIETDDKCSKCKKDLYPKNHLFKDYLYNHIKSNLKSKVKDKIFSYLKNYIISHLYGCGLVVSIIFTGTVLIFNHNNYYKVNSVNDILKSNNNEVIVNVYSYDDYDYNFPVPTTSGYIISGNLVKIETIKITKGSSITKWCENITDSDLCVQDAGYINDKLTKKAREYQNVKEKYINWYESNNCANNMKKCAKEYESYNHELYEIINELTGSIDENNIFDKNQKLSKDISIYVKYSNYY